MPKGVRNSDIGVPEDGSIIQDVTPDQASTNPNVVVEEPVGVVVDENGVETEVEGEVPEDAPLVVEGYPVDQILPGPDVNAPDLTVDPPAALPSTAITETKGLSVNPGINEGGAIDPPEIFSEQLDEEGQLVGASNTTSSPAAYYSIFNQFTTGSNGTVQTSQYQTHIWDKGF